MYQIMKLQCQPVLEVIHRGFCSSQKKQDPDSAKNIDILPITVYSLISQNEKRKEKSNE